MPEVLSGPGGCSRDQWCPLPKAPPNRAICSSRLVRLVWWGCQSQHPQEVVTLKDILGGCLPDGGFRLAFPRSPLSMLIIILRNQAAKVFLQLTQGPEAMGDGILLSFGHLCEPKGRQQQLREQEPQFREGTDPTPLLPVNSRAQSSRIP